MTAINIATLVVALCLLVFWWWQLIQLMCLADADFPGRHDKLIWAALFLVAFFLAPFIFMQWKSVYPAVLAETRRRRDRGDSAA